MKRCDTICDCCGKVLDRYEIIKLHGTGILVDWTTTIRGQKVDLCKECWTKFLDFVEKKGDIQ